MYRERKEWEYRRRGRSRSPHRDNRPHPPPQDSRVLYSRDYNHGREPESHRERYETSSESERFTRDEDVERSPRMAHSRGFDVEGERRGEENDFSERGFDRSYTDRRHRRGEIEQGHSLRPFEEYESRRDFKEYNYRNDMHEDVPSGSFVDFGNNGFAEEEEVADTEVAAMFEDELDILEGNVVEERDYRGMGFYCDVCKTNSTSVQSLQKHFAGAKHRKNLAKKGLSNDLDHLIKLPKDEAVSDTILKCVLCNVILQGSEIDIHSKATKHREMLSQIHVSNKYSGETQWYEPVNTATEAEPNISISENHFECKMCAVVLLKEEHFLLHLNGKKHQKRMRWKHISGNDLEDCGNDSAQFWCSICGIFCSDREVLDKHFAGKKHAKMLRLKGVSEDEIKEGMESNVKVFPENPVTTTLLDKVEDNKPKKSLGLYGSLPRVLAANEAAGSSSQGKVTPSFVTSTVQGDHGEPSHSTVKSGSTSKPLAPKNVDKVPNPISVGAFLQSIQGEDPCSKMAVKKEPEDSEFFQPKQPERVSAVSQFINKISYQLPNQPVQSALVGYPQQANQTWQKPTVGSTPTNYPTLVQYPVPSPSLRPSLRPGLLKKEGSVGIAKQKPKQQKVMCLLCKKRLLYNDDIHKHLASPEHAAAVRANPGAKLEQCVVPVD